MTQQVEQRAQARHAADTLLTTWLVLLLALPTALAVGSLGTAGAPATIVSMVGFGAWVWFHVHRGTPFVSPRRVRVAVLVAFLACLATYAHAMSGPIPGDELTPADSGLLRMMGLCGVALLACDGIASIARLEVLARRLVIGVGLIAILGVIQNFTGQLWVNLISIPGLSGGLDEWALQSRGGVNRPSGTATHPIEFGVALTTVLPLAIVLARHEKRRPWLLRGLFAAIAFSTFLSVSRSAILCAVVGVGVLALGWPARLRAWAAAAGAAAAVAAYVAVPGLLGVLGTLFVGAADDSSVHSRTASYDVALMFIERNPLLGRGLGTFVPDYRILDNEYLLLAIEVGLVGLTAFLVLFACSAWAAHTAMKRARDARTAELCRALMASVLAGTCGFAFFDTLSFPQSAGVLFLVIGLSGAALRLHPATTVPDPTVPERTPAWPR